LDFTGLRGEAVFRATTFAARAGLAFADDAAFGATFGRETLTDPLAARAFGRAFAAALIVGRRADLLREVEAMATTLGTVET